MLVCNVPDSEAFLRARLFEKELTLEVIHRVFELSIVDFLGLPAVLQHDFREHSFGIYFWNFNSVKNAVEALGKKTDDSRREPEHLK